MTQTAASLPDPRLYVDGTFTDASDEGTFEVISPSTGEPVASVASATAEDVDAAVRAARAQFDGGAWSRMSGAERGRVLNKVADAIEADVENLARLEALDVSKPIFDGLHVDIPLVVETFRHFAGWADKLHGSSIPLPDHMGHARLAYTRREPVGVIGAITPWNAPTMIASWKIAPALATGCTVVLKPPEDAPLTSLRLAELFAEAGVPDGVFNVVPGTGAVAGAGLVSHPGVDKISFTGSPEVGRQIGREAGAAFKRVTLELGGKSPQIVFPDADVEALLPIAALSVFANQGEICAAGSRIIVHESVVDQVIAGLADAARSMRVGDPFDETTNMGALISQRQLDRVLGYVDSGREEGADLVAGGNRLDRAGYFVEPTVFAGNNDLRIAREEIFGPVATVIPFREPDEAIALANDTNYGLIGIVWTRDLSTAHKTAAALKAGKVWVNGWGAPDPRLPWGGLKQSGIGRELGLAGLDGCTEEKVVSVVL